VNEFRSERHIIGESAAIRRVLQTVTMAAPTRATVLLQGESGTGKELFARAVHDQSNRRDHPFIQLNCAALPEGLIESALFGHEKGAFTGAVKRVEGAFERAHRGTLLLDEVSEMRLDLQAKLLRVLQEQEFERVGGTVPIRVDVRIIATTNRELASEVEAGTFRRDLYYRLGVIPILIPPLRERKEDIAILAQRFAVRTASEIGKNINGIAPDAIQLLQSMDWAGNVRELQHAVERAVIFTTEGIVQAHAFDASRYGLTPASSSSIGTSSPALLPPVVDTAAAGEVVTPGTPVTAAGPSGPFDPSSPVSLALQSLNVDDAEKQLIARALEAAEGNRTKAAELLGISVRTLRNKLNTPGKDD
jgi:transcriptional regulator with GAF, ATPase, and Fis domain